MERSRGRPPRPLASVDLSLEQLRSTYPGIRVDGTTRFVLHRIFEATRTTLAAILRAHETERPMREAIETFWSYQMAGLRAVAKRVGRGRPRSGGSS